MVEELAPNGTLVQLRRAADTGIVVGSSWLPREPRAVFPFVSNRVVFSLVVFRVSVFATECVPVCLFVCLFVVVVLLISSVAEIGDERGERSGEEAEANNNGAGGEGEGEENVKFETSLEPSRSSNEPSLDSSRPPTDSSLVDASAPSVTAA